MVGGGWCTHLLPIDVVLEHCDYAVLRKGEHCHEGGVRGSEIPLVQLAGKLALLVFGALCETAESMAPLKRCQARSGNDQRPQGSEGAEQAHEDMHDKYPRGHFGRGAHELTRRFYESAFKTLLWSHVRTR